MPKLLNLQLIDRFYNEMWNKFDKSVLPEILHEDLTFRGSLGQIKRGLDEFGEYVDFVQLAFPDFHNRIIETLSEENRTFVRLSYTGTHQGELFGIPATGKKIEYAGAAVFKIYDGKIADVWVLGDIYGLLEQLRS
ncbi:MAG: ester cyclase [Acidiferrobacterales bacterium]